MPEKKFKTKDMVIAVFCTLIAVLCIVFYFLPAITVRHSASPGTNYEVVNYSAWDITRAAFTNKKVIDGGIAGLTYIKDVYGFAIILSGVLMPLGMICAIATTVFAYLSWLKNIDFKKYCFLFSLCGMVFTTITLIANWFVAIQIKDGNNFNFFYFNVKGSMAYGSFVSLILAFVIAIIACAYNYFLDNFDDEDEDEEDDEDEEEEEEVKPKRRKKVEEEEAEEVVEEKPAPKPRTRTAKPKAE